MNLKFGRVRLNPMGFWEVENKPTPQELDFYYANKYYQEVKRACDAKCTPDELHYISIKLEQHLAIISRYRVDKKPGTLLDVGCGEGYTLDFFRKRGWDVKGIDFSSAGIRSKNLDCLDVLIIGDVYRILSDEMSSGRTYDVIFLKNVLEHVISPIELLKSLRKITSPNGIVVVTVPNDFSITQLFAQKHQHISENRI